jgi:small subunit ribosomal protein S8
MMTDPIADMLTRIRNAGFARHAETSCPTSKQKLAIAGVLQRAGFLDSVRVEEREGHARLVLGIRYDDGGKPLIDGIQRVSKPGRRVYVGKDSLPRVRNGLGVAVISTSHGVLSDREAREQSLGGELICEVW